MEQRIHMVHPAAFNGPFRAGDVVLQVDDGNLDCPPELVEAALQAGFRPGPGRQTASRIAEEINASLAGEERESDPHAGEERTTQDLGTLAPIPVAALVGDDDAGTVILVTEPPAGSEQVVASEPGAEPLATTVVNATASPPVGITTATGLNSAPRPATRKR